MLVGIRVLELGQVLSAPFAGAILGDLGAEVLKIERVEGDDARRIGPDFRHGDALTFHMVNRTKRPDFHARAPAREADAHGRCGGDDGVVPKGVSLGR